MATKPTIADSRWATDGGAELTAPSSGERDSGFVTGTDIVADHSNVLHKEAYKWAQYLDEGILTGALHLNGAISPAAIGGGTDNYDPTGWSSGTGGAQVIRQDLSADATLTGLAGGATGRLAIITNIDATFDLFFTHDATSTAANRFYLPGDTGYRLRPGQTAVFRYDATSSRWRLIGGNGKSKKVLILGGGRAQPRSETADWTLGGEYVYTQNDSLDAMLGVDFLEVGAYLEAVVCKLESSGNAGTREIQLIVANWDDDVTGLDVIANASSTTTSSTLTLTLDSGNLGTGSGPMPLEIEDNKRYAMNVNGTTGDSWFAFKFTYYPA